MKMNQNQKPPFFVASQRRSFLFVDQTLVRAHWMGSQGNPHTHTHTQLQDILRQGKGRNSPPFVSLTTLAYPPSMVIEHPEDQYTSLVPLATV